MLTTVTWIWDDYEKRYKELRSVARLKQEDGKDETVPTECKNAYWKKFTKH